MSLCQRLNPLLPISVCQSEFVASIFNGRGDERKSHTTQPLPLSEETLRTAESRFPFSYGVGLYLDGNSPWLHWSESAVPTKKTSHKNPVVAFCCFRLSESCKIYLCNLFILFLARHKDLMFPGAKSFQEVPRDKDKWYLLARITCFVLLFFTSRTFPCLLSSTSPEESATFLLYSEMLGRCSAFSWDKCSRWGDFALPVQRTRWSWPFTVAQAKHPPQSRVDSSPMWTRRWLSVLPTPPTLQCHTLSWMIELSRGRLQINTGLL